MSHTVEVKVKFKKDQAPALQKAFQTLGWKWKENSTMKEYTGQGRKQYRYVAVNPSSSYNAYDVGFELKGDELVPFTDTYGGSVESQLGKDWCKLKAEHAFRVIEDHYEAIGAMVSRQTINGKQVVTVDDYS